MLGRGRVGVDSGFWVREAGSSLGLAVSFLEVARIARVLCGLKGSRAQWFHNVRVNWFFGLLAGGGS